MGKKEDNFLSEAANLNTNLERFFQTDFLKMLYYPETNLTEVTDTNIDQEYWPQFIQDAKILGANGNNYPKRPFQNRGSSKRNILYIECHNPSNSYHLFSSPKHQTPHSIIPQIKFPLQVSDSLLEKLSQSQPKCKQSLSLDGPGDDVLGKWCHCDGPGLYFKKDISTDGPDSAV